MGYLQGGRYKGLMWDSLTDYSRLNSQQIDTLMPELAYYKNVNLEHNGEIIDLPHMMVNLNALTSTLSKIGVNVVGVGSGIIIAQFNQSWNSDNNPLNLMGLSCHISGFLGDLQSSIGQAVLYSNATTSEEFAEDVVRSIGVDKVIYPSGEEAESAFGREDLNADLDAVNLKEIFMDDNNIVNALRKYYCENNDRNRAESFINNMGGEEKIERIIMNNIPVEEQLVDTFITRKNPKYIGIWLVSNYKGDEWNERFGLIKNYYNREEIAKYMVNKIKLDGDSKNDKK